MPAETGWARWLLFPRAKWVALAAAAALVLPTLGLGYFADDYVHLGALEGLPTPQTKFDLFRFAPGDPEEIRPWITQGPYPWWTLPEVKLRFWRPLSSGLAVLEHAVFGLNPVWMHLHSVLWYLAAVLVVAGLYRRTLAGAAAGLAALIWAVDPGHFLPVAWIANRNALIAATPALLGVLLHLEWRERGRRWALPAALACFALGLAGGETALGALAYVAAYELVAGPGDRMRRVRSLLPVTLLLVAYVVNYRLSGYGAYGSGTYIDPSRDPAAFLLAAPGRILALLAGKLTLLLAADYWIAAAELQGVLIAGGALATTVLVLLLRAAWSRLDAEEQRHASWLGLGALLALVPVASTFPSNRLFLVPGVGVGALLALLMREGWRAAPTAPALLRRSAAPLAALHLGLASFAWLAVHPIGYRLLEEFDSAVRPKVLADVDLSGRHVVTLAVPGALTAMYPMIVRALERGDLPRSFHPLSLAPRDLALTRTGERTFDLAVIGGRFGESVFEQLVRSADHPMRDEEVIALAGATVTVREVDGAWPARITYESERSLDDEANLFLSWEEGEYRRFRFPPVGERVVLPFRPGLLP